MAAQDYDKALIRLQEYIIKNPLDFDAAQKRIKKIISSRIAFSETAEKLVETLVSEPLNDKKKLEMIGSLENLLENNPNFIYLDFIQETKTAAQFTYYRAVFDEIMENGQKLIENEAYIEAIDLFYSGLDLYQKEFFEENQDLVLKQDVEQKLKRLPNLIADFSEILNELNEAKESFSKIQKESNLEAIIIFFPYLKAAFEHFASYQNEIQTIGQFFNDSFIRLQEKKPQITEASFLPFANRFLLGKQNSETTGIIASYNQQWNKKIEPLLAESQKLIEKKLNTSIAKNKELIENFHANSLESAKASYIEIEKALENTKNLIAIYQLKNTNDGRASDYENESLKENITILTYLLEEYKVYASNHERLENEKMLYATKDINNLRVYASQISKTSQEILDINLACKLAEERVQKIKEPAFENFLVFFDTFEENLRQTIDTNIAYLSEEWNLFANRIEANEKEIENHYNASYAQGIEKLNVDKKENPITFLALSYPAESIIFFNDILKNIDGELARIKTRGNELLEAKRYNEKLFTKKVEETNQYLSKLAIELEKLKSNTIKNIAIAQEKILLAERAKNEANLRVSQVETALKNESFQTARDNLSRARTKFNESLDYQESESLRKESDNTLALLASEITRKENEIVIRDVRKLKTDAKTAYYQGNFERAENLLIQAENRFAVTNVEKDEETTSLLVLVGTALSMKTGRVILPSAPLYPEMSQILSLAKQYYEKGKTLLAENKRNEALLLLNDAKKKIRELQTVYPLNQEASLLVLRIDQVIDPAAFADFFAQRFTQAKNEYRDVNKRQTAYTDLLDLAEINPRYPGLSDFIYNAEIEMGIRIRPPDQKALAESKQLTQEAALVVNSSSRNEIQLNAALAKLNTALEKNPNNEEAMVLKDRVQIMIGGRTAIVLSSESEELYQRAILELQRGNVLQAAGIVNTLLQKKENQNSSKIIDLKKKVDSLL